MLSVIGCAALAIETALSAFAALVCYQLYGRHPTLDHAVLLFFSLGHTYSVLTLLVGALIPVRLVYERPDLLELWHRSRYILFDCVAMPSVLWMVAFLIHRGREELGLPALVASLFDTPARLVAIAILAVAHLAVAFLASQDCFRYPMGTDNCLGVLYWRPARFTRWMQLPWKCSTRSLWLLAFLWLLVARRPPWLLLAAAVLRLAYHGHMSQYWYPNWEIFLQPLAATLVTCAFLQAMDISLQCDMRRLDPSTCIVQSPKGPVALFMSGGRLRF
eukprot:TRINITY_DN9810_c1_g1_i6.p1 TRINITY_DN9810_c1_g1~~TRINITY_DN9810_c1_g1_i6.p1  ORF type:complete len:275 (+),score=39.33 TRINITY_DN9810_c1_g1_i6:134-958(+)